MQRNEVPSVELVPVDQIKVINPRARNRKLHREIVENIAEIGLKKPITVARRSTPEGDRYDLVCGQGRLEAYQRVGEPQIPAIVVDADEEDCLIMSLVENLARRQHRAIDLLRDIVGMRDRGYEEETIAAKTGLTLEYVRGVIKLLDKGEHRLLRGVESGHIPLSVAVAIADSDDTNVQIALQEAYESKLLRGRKLMEAKKLIEQRRRRGKGLRSGSQRREPGMLSSAALIRTYKEETERKRLLVRKAETARDRLLFVIHALKTLLADAGFVTLLRAEGLETLPRNLADRIGRAA